MKREAGAESAAHDAVIRRIRLIALDLDDTVLRADKTISARTERAIRVAVCGVPCRFRQRPSFGVHQAYAKELGVEGHCIALNGAVVATSPELQRIREQYLEPDLVKRILALDRTELRAENVFLEYPRSYAARFDAADVHAYAILAEGPASYIGDLQRASHDEVCKVVFRADDTPFPTLERLREALGDQVAYVIWEGPWSFVEVLPLGTSKAAALEWLAARLGVAREEVLAVGDERNDIEMLAWAGTGVAMGNAHPEVKAVADWVTAPVEEDGCAAPLNALSWRRRFATTEVSRRATRVQPQIALALILVAGGTFVVRKAAGSELAPFAGGLAAAGLLLFIRSVRRKNEEALAALGRRGPKYDARALLSEERERMIRRGRERETQAERK